MNIELYKKFLKAKTEYKLFVTYYNSLVDIANAPFETYTYILNKEKYDICCARHTVDKAKQTIRLHKQIFDFYNSIPSISYTNENYLDQKELMNKINEYNEKFNQNKFYAMRDAIYEISKAKIHYLKTDIFDGFFCYYNKETIDIAQNCLKRINQYI